MIFQPQIVGKPLPALTNPGTAADLRSGKQLIDASGNVLTGNATIPKVFLYGKVSRYSDPSVGSELAGSEWEQYVTYGTASNWLYVDIPVTLHDRYSFNTRYYAGSSSLNYSQCILNGFYGYIINGASGNYGRETIELDFGSKSVLNSLNKLPLLICKDDGTGISAQYWYVITEA